MTHLMMAVVDAMEPGHPITAKELAERTGFTTQQIAGFLSNLVQTKDGQDNPAAIKHTHGSKKPNTWELADARLQAANRKRAGSVMRDVLLGRVSEVVGCAYIRETEKALLVIPPGAKTARWLPKSHAWFTEPMERGDRGVLNATFWLLSGVDTVTGEGWDRFYDDIRNPPRWMRRRDEED